MKCFEIYEPNQTKKSKFGHSEDVNGEKWERVCVKLTGMTALIVSLVE